MELLRDQLWKGDGHLKNIEWQIPLKVDQTTMRKTSSDEQFTKLETKEQPTPNLIG